MQAAGINVQEKDPSEKPRPALKTLKAGLALLEYKTDILLG